MDVDVIFSKDGATWRVPTFWRGGSEWTVFEGLTILIAGAVDVVRLGREKAIQCRLREKYEMKERPYEKE